MRVMSNGRANEGVFPVSPWRPTCRRHRVAQLRASSRTLASRRSDLKTVASKHPAAGRQRLRAA